MIFCSDHARDTQTWSKEFSWGPKLTQIWLHLNIWTKNANNWSGAFFTQFVTWFLSLLLACVIGTQGRPTESPVIDGHRSVPAWWQTSCQVRIPSTRNGAPSDSFISNRAFGISHRTKEPLVLQGLRIRPDSCTAAMPTLPCKKHDSGWLLCLSRLALFPPVLLSSLPEDTSRTAAFALGRSHLC